MSWINTAFHGLFETAVVSFIVLAAGGLLAFCWSRPVERLRCLQGTFLAVLLACLLQQFHVLPSIPLAWLPAEPDQVVTTSAAGQGSDDHLGSNGVARRAPRFSEGDESVEPIQGPKTERRPPAAVAALAEDALASAPPAPAAAKTARSLPAWIPGAVLTLFLIGASWSLLRMAVGIHCLRGLKRGAAAATNNIVTRLKQIQGDSRRHVTVLVSSAVDAPITFGIVRPVIVLPASLANSMDDSVLHNCLAHEWSHVRNFDVAQWWGLQLLQPVLWYQPLYWVLRRELRIGQDQLADHFAAVSTSDSIAYAELLVRMAKARHLSQTGVALTMSDRGKSLTRRVTLLLSAQHHLTPLCRRWALASALCVLSLVTCAMGVLKLERARAQSNEATEKMTAEPKVEAPKAEAGNPSSAMPTAEPQAKPTDSTPKSPPVATKSNYPQSVLGEEHPDGSISYTGQVVDKETKAPIKGAEVTVHRRTSSSYDRRNIEDTKHTTDEKGEYSFTIPPEQVAEKLLYIELDVIHADYADKTGFGYALGMIRKNSKLGDPPFFYHVELDPADAITGRVVDPDGKPVADAPLQVYSHIGDSLANDNYGSFFDTKSATDGTFRLKLVKGGNSVFWIVPEKYCPRQIVSGAKRGDWGDVELQPGIGMAGHVVDAEGKPVPGVWANFSDSNAQSEIQMPVATSLERSGLTDSEGRFEIAPLKPGEYRMVVEGYPGELRFQQKGRTRVDVPAVFPRRVVTITDKPQELMVRAVPHVQFDGQYYDGKGQKRKGGWDISLHGRLDGASFFGRLKPDAEGHITGMIPHGLEKAELDVIGNEHAALRVRPGKDKPLINDRRIELGTIEADVTGVEIIRYTAPIVQLKVVDEAGQPISGVKVAAVYEGADPEKLRQQVNNLPTSIYFENQSDGRFRTSQMQPDMKTTFKATAEGYQDAQETLMLPEGEERELTLVLKKATPPSDQKLNAASMTPQSAPMETPKQDAIATATQQPAAEPSITDIGKHQVDGSVVCSGVIVDRATEAPVVGAQIMVRRKLPGQPDDETTHTSDQSGQYSFTLTRDQAVEARLRIGVILKHPQYAPRNVYDEPLGVLRENNKLGDPPAFTRIALSPSDPLTGRIVTPAGEPLADVSIEAYAHSPRDSSQFFHAKSGADGKFQINLFQGAPASVWIVPEKYAPRQVFISTTKHDVGDIALEAGTSLKGQLLDAEGRPLSGAWVIATDDDARMEANTQGLTTHISRSSQADAAGHFEIGPMHSGRTYTLHVAGQPEENSPPSSKRVDVPAVFLRRKVTFSPETQEPLVLRAVPHVEISLQFFDGQGAPTRGSSIQLTGHINRGFYSDYLYPDSSGHAHGLVPHGLGELTLYLQNIDGPVRSRAGAGKPLEHGGELALGTVEADVTGVEVIRYTTPTVFLKPIDEMGQPVVGVKVAGVYEADDDTKLPHRDGELPSSVSLNKRPDGRFRTYEMLPDEKTKFIAAADGYETAQQALSLAEGETRELTLVLKKKAEVANSTSEAPPAKLSPEFGEERPDGSIFYAGQVVERGSKTPIKGAVVSIRRSSSTRTRHQPIEETKHTTDAQGKYSFTIPAEQVAEKALYVEAQVDHPDYVPKSRGGYALSMLRKNAALGDPPWFAHLELAVPDPFTGRIVGPDGQPVAGVHLRAYSRPDDKTLRGSWIRGKSADDGTFKLNLMKGGSNLVWMAPEQFVPRQFILGHKSGPQGDIPMQPGTRLSGQVLDAEGKPVPGVWVNFIDDDAAAEIKEAVATAVCRSGFTDAEGRFEVAPLKPGKYSMEVRSYARELRFQDWEAAEENTTPATFLDRTIVVGEAPEPIVVRAVPHVQFDAQFVTSKGEKTRGWDADVYGEINGRYYFGDLKMDPDGRVRGILPHGLEKARLRVSSNEHSSLRVRLAKDKPPEYQREIPLGTVEGDIAGVEIIRYVAPIVQLKVVDEAGQAVSKPNLMCFYTREGDGPLTTVHLELQDDGRYRTWQLLPDQQTKITASAEGYEKAEETLSLPEGDVRDLTLILKRSGSMAQSTTEPVMANKDK